MSKKPKQQQPKSFGQIKSPSISKNDQKPLFSFHHHGKDYCIEDCELHEKVAFSIWMYKLSQFTWGELATEPRTGFGYEHIPRKQFIPNPPKSLTEEVDKYMVFRFHNPSNGRIIGYRLGEVFHIIWIDCTSSAYNHGS